MTQYAVMTSNTSFLQFVFKNTALLCFSAFSVKWC